MIVDSEAAVVTLSILKICWLNLRRCSVCVCAFMEVNVDCYKCLSCNSKVLVDEPAG
jgi:hypothetical protein